MTSFADAMAAFVRTIHPDLKRAGFRKRRHTFNRSVEDGVVQVVNFQMGPKLPPGTEPIPRLRPDLHGLFTVNLGVAVHEAWQLERQRLEGWGPDDSLLPPQAPGSFPAFLNDYDCQIRVRLGELTHERDTWWSLDEPVERLSEALGSNSWNLVSTGSRAAEPANRSSTYGTAKDGARFRSRRSSQS